MLPMTITQSPSPASLFGPAITGHMAVEAKALPTQIVPPVPTSESAENNFKNNPIIDKVAADLFASQIKEAAKKSDSQKNERITNKDEFIKDFILSSQAHERAAKALEEADALDREPISRIPENSENIESVSVFI